MLVMINQSPSNEQFPAASDLLLPTYILYILVMFFEWFIAASIHTELIACHMS